MRAPGAGLRCAPTIGRSSIVRSPAGAAGLANLAAWVPLEETIRHAVRVRLSPSGNNLSRCGERAWPLQNGQSGRVIADPEAADSSLSPRRTLWQRMLLRRLRRMANKGKGEPLSSADWKALWELNDSLGGRVVHRIWRVLPTSPRCGLCSAPFAGPGRFVVRPLGYRPSRKNPTLCATCVEVMPPGGMNMHTGVLFADLRGFTSRSEGLDPEDVSKLLRRFYGCAERVLFPEAIIDKLIGDEVMALYLPDIQRRIQREEVAPLMVEHAKRLLRAVGYGTDEDPFVEVGVGLDVGEAFVGNIGDRAVFDFTAVGDVVNTASRLQQEAAGGEIMLSERVAAGLPTRIGTRVELALKGLTEATVAYRIPNT
jgi:adenylate cyclase